MKRSIKSLILLMVLAVFAGGYFLIDALTNRQANVQESAGSYPLLGEGANIAALSWSGTAQPSPCAKMAMPGRWKETRNIRSTRRR